MRNLPRRRGFHSPVALKASLTWISPAGSPVLVSGPGKALLRLGAAGTLLGPEELVRELGEGWVAEEALAIALEDVRLHGGWLQAWGEPAQGAAFRMTLPCHVGAAFDSSPLPLQPVAA